MSLFRRSNCAPHLDDISGNTYDSKGKVCGGLSSDDKLYIALGSGLCGAIILGLGITYLIRRRNKSRSRLRSLQHDQAQMLQTSHNAPLLGGWGSQRFNRPNETHMDLSPISTISSPTMSYPEHPSPVPGSPYSPNPETFHFPILSADGYLLPPAPASAARSPSPSSMSSVSFERPLPSPPMDGMSAFSLRGSSSNGHSDDYSRLDQEEVGSWSDQGYGGEMDIGQANVRGPLSPIMESPVSRTTPRFNAGLGFVTPSDAPSYTYDERGALVRDYR